MPKSKKDNSRSSFVNYHDDSYDVDETMKIEADKDDYEAWTDYINAFYSSMKKIDEDSKASNNVVRPTWNDMFMQIAEVVAKRSKDPHTKVGAVIVKDNHILGIGYNAEPKGFSYDFDWHSKEKYDYVIHAELNAIANSTYFGNSIAGSTIYLTLSPCSECMKLLIQYGIGTIYYKDKYKDFEKSERMAKYSNIKLIKYDSR